MPRLLMSVALILIWITAPLSAAENLSRRGSIAQPASPPLSSFHFVGIGVLLPYESSDLLRPFLAPAVASLIITAEEINNRTDILPNTNVNDLLDLSTRFAG